MVVLLMAVGLKYHYSHARSDDLGWILGPTAGGVEYISGIDFEKEDGAGFVNRANRIIIAPSCAGVNFLIIAFCMAAFSGLHHLKSSGLKIFWIGQQCGNGLYFDNCRKCVQNYCVHLYVQSRYLLSRA